jgi:hypothetical protein
LDPESSDFDAASNNPACGRIAILGNVIHSMSPFEGTGSNQALLDVPMLATWLQQASLPSVIKGFYRNVESHSTTRPFVHKAAAFLHSPLVLLVDFGQDDAGAVKDHVPELLQELNCHWIGAQLKAVLDSQFGKVIDELNCTKVGSRALLLAQK